MNPDDKYQNSVGEMVDWSDLDEAEESYYLAINNGDCDDFLSIEEYCENFWRNGVFQKRSRSSSENDYDDMYPYD